MKFLRLPIFPLAVLIMACAAHGQIRIVASDPGSDDVALGDAYVQTFDSLPASGSATWSDNTTLKGWYANLTRGQVSAGSMVATGITSVSAVTTGSVGGSATLNSLGASGSANRALGGTPGAYATGSANIFSSQSVNVVLRLKNSTTSVLTGLKVSYQTVATSTSNKDAVSLAYRTFSAGAGTISSNFLETHRYLNSFNGTYNESMRTEFGRRTSSTSGWSAVIKDIAPVSSSSRTNDYIFTLRDIAVGPGEELWLAWHISKEDEQGASDPITTTAIDNVRVEDFTVSRPGIPFITTHPRSLAVATGGTRDFTLSVGAKGSGLSYQWRKDGTNISGATAATYTATNVSGTAEGIYDCVVSNAGGTVTSLPAKVNIYARATVSSVKDVSFAAYSSGISELEASSSGTLCDLYYPSTLTPSSTKVPAIIVIHGGGGNNGDKSDSRETDAATELASRGWFVMVINYAMSSSTAQCWPYNLWDAKQAVRWLKQKSDAGTYAVDKNKIGVLGFSWGCNMASMLAMTSAASDVGISSSTLKVEPPARGNSYDTYSTTVQCAAVFYGAADLPNYHQMNQFLDYTAWDNRTLYRRASPINYPNASAAPMFVAHGSSDDDVWQSQTETTYHMQRSLKAELENYLQVPGGEHSFALYETTRIASGFPNPIDVRPETLGFLEKYLVETTRRPAIQSEPVSVLANASSTASFSVQAIGAPAPSYQWRKDGVAIAGATSASLAVTATSANAGYYDVVVTNSAGSVASTAGQLTVLGASTNVPPVAVNDTASAAPATAALISVLANDSDSDGGTLSVLSVTQGAHGSVVNNAGASVTYTPEAGFTGTDSFSYTLSDGQGDTDTATVNVFVGTTSAQVTVAAAGTIESTSASTNIDEATLGYVATKYNANPATSAARKAYFQFDVSALNVSAGGTATFTVNFTNSFQQNVQLWALNQTYAGDVSALTWNGAPANDTASNNMLAAGGVTATAIGAPVVVPASYPAAATFSIANVGNYVKGGKVVLVLTGVTSASNNSSGARYNRTNATLDLPLAQANTPPTISDISNRTVPEDTATSVIAFTVGDSETAAENLVLTASSSNTNKVPLENIVLAGSGASRTVQVTPAANQVGQSTVTITVTDEGGEGTSDSFIVTVTAVNDPPTIDDIANQTINANTSAGPVSFGIADIDSAVASLAVSATSSNPALVPNANLVLGGADNLRSISVTPAANQSGTCTVTVTVGDGVATITETFLVTVLPTLQSWWMQNFGTSAPGSGSSAANADPDADGMDNLLEYSQGGNPLLNDASARRPAAVRSGGSLVFTYRKAALDLSYSVEQKSDLGSGDWIAVSAPEVDNGDGTFSRTVPVGGSQLFLRLKVTAQ